MSQVLEKTQVQVISVTGKGTARGTVWELAAGDGRTYGTFDGAIAARANELQGQVADIQFETTQKFRNGQNYTNYYLKDIAPAGQMPAQAQPVQPGTPLPDTSKIPMQAPPIPDSERQKLIVRQNVLSTAFSFVGVFAEQFGGDFEASKGEALKLASELYAKVFQPNGAAAEPVIVPDTEAVDGARAEAAEAPRPQW